MKNGFTFIYIVLNGMPFIEHSINSIYKLAEKIIIVHGSIKNSIEFSLKSGASIDGTGFFLKNYHDPEKKVLLINGKWNEKVDMHNAALKEAKTNWIWLIDSDEVYFPSDIEKLCKLINSNPNLTRVDFIPINFWKTDGYVIDSDVLFRPEHHYRRVFKLSDNDYFITHRPPTLASHKGLDFKDTINYLSGKFTFKNKIYLYHYSYVLNQQVKQKINLHIKYAWGENWGLDLQDWYYNFYLKWNDKERTILEHSYGTWTGDKNSVSKKYNDYHPLSDFLSQIKINFNNKFSINDEAVFNYISSVEIKKELLNTWKHITKDLPLKQRFDRITQSIDRKDNFWNIHVALTYLNKRFSPDRVLEVGTRTGGSICPVISSGKPRIVFCVDLWSESYAGLPNSRNFTLNQIQSNLDNERSNTSIHLIQGNSHDILPKFILKSFKFDLINIDGDHTEEGAWQDLVDAESLLAERAILTFDDINHKDHQGLLDICYKFLYNYEDFKLIINTRDDNGTAIFLKNIDFQEFYLEEVIPLSNLKEPYIAEDFNIISQEDLTKIDNSFEFSIQNLIAKEEIEVFLETGTYHGTGSTTVIASAIKSKGKNQKLLSIEVNPKNVEIAKNNLSCSKLLNFVKIYEGLSIPVEQIPQKNDISKSINNIDCSKCTYIDHRVDVRNQLYFNETNFNKFEDDLIGKILNDFNSELSFFLLDSGAHIGFIEFFYLINKINCRSFIALDDIFHYKHYRSYDFAINDPRFNLKFKSNQKFGSCIFEFNPN